MLAGRRRGRSGVTWGASMRAHSLRLLSIAALVVAPISVLASAEGAGAAVGPGTFTTITTPAGATKTIQFHGAPASTTLTVSGQASADVTTVDIDCVLISA